MEWRQAADIDIESVAFDLMQSKYLGCDAYLLGSVLTYMVDVKIEGGGSAQDRLEALWAQIREGYDREGTVSQYGHMTLNMFRGGKAPFSQLKGKAAEIRHLLPILLHICKDQGRLSNAIQREALMIRAMEQSLLVDKILEHNNHLPVLSSRQKGLLVEAVRNYNRLVQALGTVFHPQGLGLFNCTIKAHVLEALT